MYFPLFVGVLCLSLFYYALLCVHSSFAIILKRKLVALLLVIVLQMYCYYKCNHSPLNINYLSGVPLKIVIDYSVTKPCPNRLW